MHAPGTPSFHLREGFYFARLDNKTVRLVHGGVELDVPVTEWASAVASTSLRGDTGDTWREAVEYLNRKVAAL